MRSLDTANPAGLVTMHLAKISLLVVEVSLAQRKHLAFAVGVYYDCAW